MVDNRLSQALYKTITSRRTIRRFKPKVIPWDSLKKLVNAAGLAPSAANLQPLEFLVVDDKKICAKVFPCLRWAAYIHPFGIPPQGRRPAAYIIVLVNLKWAREKFAAYDIGAAVENILLTAWAQDIGACWMQSIDRIAIRRILHTPAHLQIDSVVSLGFRDESPKVERLKGSVKYWKDTRGILRVPKRELKEILHHNIYRRRCGKIK